MLIYIFKHLFTSTVVLYASSLGKHLAFVFLVYWVVGSCFIKNISYVGPFVSYVLKIRSASSQLPFFHFCIAFVWTIFLGCQPTFPIFFFRMCLSNLCKSWTTETMFWYLILKFLLNHLIFKYLFEIGFCIGGVVSDFIICRVNNNYSTWCIWKPVLPSLTFSKCSCVKNTFPPPCETFGTFHFVPMLFFP